VRNAVSSERWQRRDLVGQRLFILLFDSAAVGANASGTFNCLALLVSRAEAAAELEVAVASRGRRFCSVAEKAGPRNADVEGDGVERGEERFEL
jgi:hypothetical protein